MSPRNLIEIARARAADTPEELAYTFLEGGTTPGPSLTWAQVDHDARAVAGLLQDQLEPGDRALLLYPPGLDYLTSFLGCLYAGVVAVPAYPPAQGRLERSLPRIQGIAGDAGVAAVLTPENRLGLRDKVAEAGADSLDSVLWLATDALEAAIAESWKERSGSGDNLAFLQYTSGSTAEPKGVMVGHDNLLHNLAYASFVQENDADSISVSWLPAYHDMGLIEGLLQPLYSGYPAYLMSPMAFLQRPFRWLDAISRYGATNSGGPNFAYDLCVKRTTPEQRRSLDLSRWRVAYNGAEPIRRDTLEAFAAAFADSSFLWQAFYPVYGLAEATLVVSSGRRSYMPVFSAHPSEDNDEPTLVSSGPPCFDTRVVIVDNDSRPLPDDAEGEIWVTRPSIAQGYWGRSEATQRCFRARLAGDDEHCYLRTGDLGFLQRGELFVTGRMDDLIVAFGRNHYPQDLERSVEEAHPLVRTACTAAFPVSERPGGIGVAAEIDLRRMPRDADPEPLLRDVLSVLRSAIADAHGIALDKVTLLRPGRLPKTSSGKVRRQACTAGLAEDPRDTLLCWCAPHVTGDPLRRWLLEETGKHLGVAPSEVNTDHSLLDLGLDSLSTVELALELQRHLPTSPPVADLLAYPSVDALLSGDTRALDSHRTAVTLSQVDSRLPADVMPTAGVPRHTETPQTLFVTGATGFLGSRIVGELLASTTAEINCLVREKDSGAARQRLLGALEATEGWRPEHQERIRAIPGDLALPGLGLTGEKRQRLAEEADAVYHVGAAVNWAYPYAGLRDVNVRSTLELLRIACATRSTPFHYVSTLAVCWSTTATGRVDEQTPPAPEGIHLGYAASKAVADRLVQEAGARGLPVRIYRPAFVTADSRTGLSNTDDFLAVLMKGCIELGCAPDLDWELDCSPVDFVARSVVALALGAQPQGEETVVHLSNANTRHWRECILWLNLRGYPVRLLPYEQWLQILDTSSQEPSSTFYALRPFFLDRIATADGLTRPQIYEEGRRTQVSSQRSARLLEAAALSCPPMTASSLERTFDSYVARGFLPETQGPAPQREAAPFDAAFFQGHLRRFHGDSTIRVMAATPAEGRASHSIVSELCSWRYGRAAGLYRYDLRWQGEGQQGEQRLRVVVKAKPTDTEAIEIGAEVATLCGEQLGSAWERSRGDLELVGSHLREPAIYQQADPRFRQHAPLTYGTQVNNGAGSAPSAVVMEDLSGLEQLDRAGESEGWHQQQIEAALDGAAQLHAIWWRREDELSAQPWLAPPRTAQRRGAMAGLWKGLSEHAAARLQRWLGPTGLAYQRELAATAGIWSEELETLPKTLIHNDFNPRNLALRKEGGELRLCAYDWELATLGVPQRDLAELLCFVLSPNTTLEEVLHYAERHRSALSEAVGEAIEEAEWRRGFRRSLDELIVDRLPMYAMIDTFRPQRFLERVVLTWGAIDRCTRSM